MIVVTGATGQVGRLVAEELARRGERMRLLVRDPGRAPDLPAAEVVQADYAEPASLEAVLQRGDRVFMVSVHQGYDRRLDEHRSFVETAARIGVEHVVYLSFTNAGPQAIFIHARSHGATEELLGAAGVSFTAMRNGMYADEIPGWFDADGVAREPGGDARMSFSYRRELAEAIAVVLTDRRHDGRIYDITTPESVSLRELADIASDVTGDPYRYEPTSDADWVERWRARGRAEWQLETGVSVYEALRAGEFDVVSDDYRAITGRAPLTVREIVERHADALPLSRALA